MEITAEIILTYIRVSLENIVKEPLRFLSAEKLDSP